MSLTACVENPEAATEAAVREAIPFIGAEDVDSNPFQYLYKERITTETKKNSVNGEMEFKDVTVYVPESGNVTVLRDQATSGKYGVILRVDLGLSFGYEDDYTLQENLERYAESRFQKKSLSIYEKHNLELGEVSLSEDGKSASSKVSYYGFDIYDEEYSYCENYLNLRELEDGLVILIDVRIDADGVKEKTPELLQELGAFYGIAFEWNSEEAKKKTKEYDSIAIAPGFTTETLFFDLPEGWKEVESGTYAPKIEIALSNSVLQVKAQHVGESVTDSIDEIPLESDELQNMLLSAIGMEAGSDFSLKVAECDFGVAFRVSMTITQEEKNDEVAAYVIYGEDGSLYTMTAVTESGSDDEKERMEDGLETMFLTVILR